MKRFFVTVLCAVLAAMSVQAAKYDKINVDAPFKMDPIKVFVYPKRDFPITKYGAVVGGETKNTKAFADAIAACNKAGGGRVVVPKGVWFTGPIHFKSNVNLHLEEGAVIRFSDDPQDYLPAVLSTLEGMEIYNYSPLLYAFECENVAITGKGLLSPKMDTWKKWFPRGKSYMDAAARLYTMAGTGVAVEERQMADGVTTMRPYMIHFNRCKNVYFEDFVIRESPFWCIHLFMCDGAVVRGLDIKAHGHNNDGIDIEMSRNILVENCVFDQGDDAVVIKAGANQDGWRLNTPSENIVVRNCIIEKGHTMLALGSELSGGIRNVYMHDCSAPGDVMRFFYIKTNERRGGFVENIYMENVSSGKCQRVFEIDTDVLYQWRSFPNYGTRVTPIKNINMTGVTCENADAIYEIKGDDRLPVNGVNLKNIKVEQLNKFVSKSTNAENVVEENVGYDIFNGQ